MSYNLTEQQKGVVRWLVAQVRDGNLTEEFAVYWTLSGADIMGLKDGDPPVSITRGILDALVAAEMLICDPERMPMASDQTEMGRRCVLLGKAYEAVDSDFASPDTSFVTHLAPLADVTNLDSEIKTRCLPILGAGGSDPRLWDSAVRTAGVVLEERLRDVGGITDSARTGRDLVNDVYSNRGTLAGKFPQDSERQGYRDLYAGLVGALRNPYAHRLIDPTPEDGGVIIVFVDLLLKMLEDLR
jgi:hypothetical protein